MKVIAVICEYNLFHNGHLYQIEKIKERYPDALITAIMSGNFVQRGEPALLDKYKRAKAAVLCGADLVLELPFPYACASAEFFAYGAVSVADRLCGVDGLCFGSECGDISELQKISERLGSKEFAAALEKGISEKISSPVSYIRLRRELYKEMYNEELPEGSNDTLGIEYLAALRRLSSKITPFIIKREPGFTATSARQAARAKDFSLLSSLLPEESFKIAANAEDYADFSNLEGTVLGFFRMADPSTLSKYAEMGGGLEYRICECACKAADIKEFFELCSTKKYTDARIRRAVLSCITGITKEQLAAEPAFTYLLAANEKGTALLNTLRKKKSIDIITKPANTRKLSQEASTRLSLSERADRIYTLSFNKRLPADSFIKSSPYILKNSK